VPPTAAEAEAPAAAASAAATYRVVDSTWRRVPSGGGGGMVGGAGAWSDGVVQLGTEDVHADGPTAVVGKRRKPTTARS
jgi:hypothetical protein